MNSGRHRGNIAFIGMPGCGKSTVARLVARALGLPFVDCDEAIERARGKTIARIFADEGEACFRAYETQAIRDALSSSDSASPSCREAPPANKGRVVSVGGGAPLHNEALLRENATVVYLERPLAAIARSLAAEQGKRPLLAGAPDPLPRLQELYAARHAVYERCAHLRIPNETTPQAAAAAIISKLTS